MRRICMMGVLAMTLACSESRWAGPVGEVTDSAGFRIVTYNLTATDPSTYRVVGDYDLEIGILEGAGQYAFSRIVDLSVTADHRLVVSDASAQELRVFDRDGQYQRTIGRLGEGPGEFEGAPSIAGIAGDTVFAYDARSGRVTSFLLDGRLIESTVLRSGTGNRVSSLVRRTTGNYLALSRWTNPDQVAEIHDVRLELDSVVVEHLDDAGKLIDTVTVMADRSRARMVRDGGGGRLGVIQADPPYLPRAFLGSNGALDVLGRSNSFDLELTADSGPPVLLRVIGVDHPAGAEEIRLHQEAIIRESLGDRPLDAPTRQLNLGFLPDRLPAFAAVLVGDRGDVWVAESNLDASSGYDWLVFSPAGELRGSVHTPPGMQLFAIRSTFIVGSVTDELDVPFIRRYPLVAPSEN